MIFVFSEDQTLNVHENINDVRREYEGIDVEDNVYKFFDENGTRLEPVFVKPNKKGKLFGLLNWVESGIFNLKKSEVQNPLDFLEELDKNIMLESNDYFDSLDEIKMKIKG